MAKTKEKARLKKPDLKSLILGTPAKTNTVNGGAYPEGTQGFVPVADIRSGVVLTKDGRFHRRRKPYKT